MSTPEKIKTHYDFTSGDVKNLLSLKPIMESLASDFVYGFYNYVKNFDEADKYLKDDKVISKHQDALKLWFLDLFSGKYGRAYFDGLEQVGMAHVKINLPAHYVNAAMHFVKGYVRDVIRKECKDADDCNYLERSMGKIIDINLDVFTSSYIEEEKRFFLSTKVESYLIQFAGRFSYGLNLILVLGLVALGVGILGLFVYDISHILQGDIEKGILSTLGSLLMLWVVIELLDTEIEHLRGGKFAIKVFISVALVAIIRKILVMSLAHDAVEAQITLIAAVAVLGVIYWLISKVE
jgi:uncharacterized membrane protein (DUF373 family)